MMNKKEKIEFIKRFTKNVTERILKRADEIPDNWEPLELRQYIIDCFKECQELTRMKSRLKSYRNDIIVNNL